MHVVVPAVLAALLFAVGLYGLLARRNAVLVLMAVELMLNAVNLNLVAFDVWRGDRLFGGQVLTLYVVVVAAAELGIGLAVVLLIHRRRGHVDVDRLRTLRDDGTDDGSATPSATPGATGSADGATAGRAAPPPKPVASEDVSEDGGDDGDADAGAASGRKERV